MYDVILSSLIIFLLITTIYFFVTSDKYSISSTIATITSASCTDKDGKKLCNLTLSYNIDGTTYTTQRYKLTNITYRVNDKLNIFYYDNKKDLIDEDYMSYDYFKKENGYILMYITISIFLILLILKLYYYKIKKLNIFSSKKWKKTKF